MNFIVENYPLIVVVIAAIAVGIAMAIRFFKSGVAEQVKKVKEWLLYATTVAEKELGSGTGQLKLRLVYDMFVTKFPWLAKVISFERFSDLVDEVLEEMNNLLTSNLAIKNFVDGIDSENSK